ncbi:hypothetical protein E8E11_005189 [Didymella keratinophila]|nr:hypothetical protein E8E11_005189 [Didymella keratinophila]
MRAIFDTSQNYRPVHAKGQLGKGIFTPHRDASKLSKALISTSFSTPLTMRYSTDTGFKSLPDYGEDGSRGFAIRFVLSPDGHTHYDIITNNAFGFIVSTGEDFLKQSKAMKAGKMEEWTNANPHAKYFQENQAPAHSYSFATEQWHSVHAFKFTNEKGEERFFCWKIMPWPGVMKYSKADAARQSENYQFEGLAWRLKNGKPIKYRLLAQLAEEGNPTNDSAKVWPKSNESAEMGEIVVDRLWGMEGGQPAGREQKGIIYDPIPRHIQGIDVSDDPLLECGIFVEQGRLQLDLLLAQLIVPLARSVEFRMKVVALGSQGDDHRSGAILVLPYMCQLFRQGLTFGDFLVV